MWHKMRRLAVPVAIPLSIVAFVAVLVIQPWEGGDEATGAVIEYRFCNTIVRVPPTLKVRSLSYDPMRPPVVQISRKPTPADHAEPSSFINLDAVTGEVSNDKAQLEDRPLFDPVIATKRVEQATPVFWPYSDQVQEKPVYAEEGTFQHRYPDPGAGIEISLRPRDFNFYPQLIARNCRSTLTLTGNADGGVDADYSQVTPEDRTAFETLTAEVEYVEYVEDEVLETE